jgi:hypothetical protein
MDSLLRGKAPKVFIGEFFNTIDAKRTFTILTSELQPWGRVFPLANISRRAIVPMLCRDAACGPMDTRLLPRTERPWC